MPVGFAAIAALAGMDAGRLSFGARFDREHPKEEPEDKEHSNANEQQIQHGLTWVVVTPRI